MIKDDIQIEELRNFAKTAQNDGWNVEYRGGILYLSGKEMYPEISISGEKGGESWKLLNTDKAKSNIVPVGQLKYTTGIHFD